MYDLSIHPTRIEGLLRIELPMFVDERGWFKENFQAEKLHAAGFPRDFVPVQHSLAYNIVQGTTRGIHAEPWEKYASLAAGRAFAAIVDLRDGPDFGVVETFELSPAVALFIPRGCGNSYQTLEDNTAYTYLVNAHWSPTASYDFVNLFDEALAIEWPIPRSETVLSEKDARHPALSELKKRRSGEMQ